MKRIFVGGLFPEVTEDDIQKRFEHFGEVSGVEIKKKTSDAESVINTFAFVDLKISEENLSKCFSVYNKTKWKGSQIKLQLAKEDFIKRLHKERETGFLVKPKLKKQKGQHHDPLKNQNGIQDFVMRGAVPGTCIQGEDWVVGKYGRVLPIMHIPSQFSRKILTVDPSKFCHNLKRVKENEEDNPINVEKLTWQLMERKQEPRRKKQFCKKDLGPELKGCSSMKKKKTNSSENIDSFIDSRTEEKDSSYLLQVLPFKSKEFTSEGDTQSLSSDDTDVIIAKQPGRRSQQSFINPSSEFVAPKLSGYSENQRMPENTDDFCNSKIRNDDDTNHKFLSKKLETNDCSDLSDEDDTRDSEQYESEDNSILNAVESLSSSEMSSEGNEDFSASEGKKSNNGIPPFMGTFCLYKSSDKNVQERSINAQEDNTQVVIEPTAKLDSQKTAENQNATDNCKTAVSQQRSEDKTSPQNLFGEKHSVSKTGRVTDMQKNRESEIKRVESMMERSKEMEMKKKAIKQALALDNSGEKPNKKIVFDSDSSEFDEKEEDNRIDIKDVEAPRKPALFDSSSENEEDMEEEEDRFRIRPEYEGAAGNQLMKLQSRFQNDERFRMDARFIDHPDSSVEMDTDEENSGPDHQYQSNLVQSILDAVYLNKCRGWMKFDLLWNHSYSWGPMFMDWQNFVGSWENNFVGSQNPKPISEEKSRAYQILGDVLGKKNLDKVQRKKSLFRDVSAIHFDPTKEDHKQFEKEPEKKREKSVKTHSNVEDSSDEEIETSNSVRTSVGNTDENLPEVTKERFYEVQSDSFKDVFSEKTLNSGNGQFSILSLFQGEHEKEDQDLSDKVQKEMPESQRSMKDPWKQEDDERSNGSLSSSEEAGGENPVQFTSCSQSFFISSEKDERVIEGISEFCRKGELDQIRSEWLEKRQTLVNAYRTKHKSMSRKKRIAEKQKRRK